MKRLLVVFALCMAFAMVLPAVLATASADSFVDEEDIIVDLMPTKQLDKDGHVNAANCELTYERDGSVKITITGANPLLTVTWIEGTTVYQGGAIDLNENAYFCIDYGVTGSAALGDQTIFYYTRKDKAAINDLAQLWYVSMAVSADYVSYRTQHHVDETGAYVVWDWGKYINDDAAKKLFDDKQHRFMRMEMPMSGAVGDTITLYSLCVVNNPDTNGLGDVRPAPDEPTPGSDEPSKEPDPVSEDEPEPVSEDEPEPVSEDEPAPGSEDEPAPDSEDEPAPASEDEPAPDSADEPAPASEGEPAPASEGESAPASENEPAASSGNESNSAPASSSGLPTWAWILIGVGGAAVICCIIILILKAKKK